MNEDRMTALRKRVELDSKYIVSFSTSDSSEVKQSLNRHDTLLIFFSWIFFFHLYVFLLSISLFLQARKRVG